MVVTVYSLGNLKADDYELLAEGLLRAYKVKTCNLSLKLIFCAHNRPSSASDELEQSSHQEISKKDGCTMSRMPQTFY
jgi:hypothetical protein